MRVQEVLPRHGDPPLRLEEYLARYTGWRFLAPTCTTEVVIGCEGTRIYLDRPLPGEILKRLTYQPRRGPRPVKHVSADGHLLHALGVQGIHRLAGGVPPPLTSTPSWPGRQAN